MTEVLIIEADTTSTRDKVFFLAPLKPIATSNIGAKFVPTTNFRNVELVMSLGDVIISLTTGKRPLGKPHAVDAFYDCGVEASALNDGGQLVLKQNISRAWSSPWRNTKRES